MFFANAIRTLTDVQKARISLLLVFLIITAITDIRYETNDDFGMMSIVSGLYTGSPSEYIIFQNILMGIFYETLYNIFPGYNWYAATLLLIQFLAFYAIMGSLNSIVVRRAAKWAVFFTIILFYAEFTLFLQFTKVAFITSFAGIVLVLTQRNPFFGWILMALGILVRTKAFYGAFIFALPLFIYFLYFQKNRWNASLKQLTTFMAAGIFALGASWYSVHYYHSTKEWAEYYDFNKARGAVHDRTNYYGNADAIHGFTAHHGLSSNDTALFFRWMFSDKTIYTKELMQGLAERFDKYESENGYSIIPLYVKSLTDFPEIYVLLILPLLLWYTSKRDFYLRNISLHSRFILTSAGILVFYLLLFYMLFLQNLSHRLFAPLILEIFIIGIFLTAHKINSRDTSRLQSHLPLLLALFVFGAYFVYQMHDKKKNYFSTELISLLLPKQSDQIIIMTEPINFMGHIPVFDTTSYSIFAKNQYYLIGWREQSPLSQHILDRNHAANMFELILKNPGVTLYSSPGTINMLQQYFFEHYNALVRFNSYDLFYYKPVFSPSPFSAQMKYGVCKSDTIIPNDPIGFGLSHAIKQSFTSRGKKLWVNGNTYSSVLKNNRTRIKSIALVLKGNNTCLTFPLILASPFIIQTADDKVEIKGFDQFISLENVPDGTYQLLFKCYNLQNQPYIIDSNQKINMTSY